MKTNLVVQPQNVVLGYIHTRAIVAIERIGVRDHRVQVVVSARQLQDNDYGFFFPGSDVWSPWLLPH